MPSITTLKAAIAADTKVLASSTVSAGLKLATAETSCWNTVASSFANGVVDVEGSKTEVTDSYYEFLASNLDDEALKAVGTKDYKGAVTYTFRSYKGTKNAWKYATVFAAACERGVTYKEMFEATELKGKLPTKGFIEGLKKVTMTDLEKIEKLSATIETLIGRMAKKSTKKDRATAQTVIADLFNKVQELSV